MTQKEAGELLSQNMKTLYLWSLSKVSDSWAAEDLCSDIIEAAIKSAPNLRNDDAFFGYVWKIATNTYKNYLRRKSRTHTVEISDDMPDGEDILSDLEDREELGTLRRELAFLSGKYRICTVAYYFDGLSIKEISEKYGITPETVKFNLFKSRKILKEGIAMERQFGEKSFNPSPFIFSYIINGSGNQEFNTLFGRKLAGQILTAAYYEPMTISQLSFELGVASVYLEDEVRILGRYGFLNKIGNDRYQTNLLMLTKDYMDAVLPKMDSLYTDRLKSIIESLRAKLPEIRNIGFSGCDLGDNTLLWDFLAYLCIKTMQITDGGAKFRTLFGDTTGVCYAFNFQFGDYGDYAYNSLAADTDNDGNHKTCILFNACYEKINYETWKAFDAIRDDTGLYPRFTEDELNRFREIVADEFEALRLLMIDIGKLTTETLKEHSPDIAGALIDYHCPHITLWNIVGWFGHAAVSTGSLTAADEGEYPCFFGYI